jgi:hypothetical protein
MNASSQKFELSFTWQKPSVGFEWEDCPICDPFGKVLDSAEAERTYENVPEGPYLTELDYSQSLISWKPFDDKYLTLFAQFADLKPEQGTLLQWANQYGRLIDIDGNPSSIYILSKHFVIDNFLRPIHDNPHHRKGGQFYRRVKADPWLFWRNEQKELSYIAMLWEMLANQDSRLNGIIMWAHDGQRVYVYKIKKELLDEIDFERFRTDESYLLEHTVTRELLFDVRDRTENDMWMTRYCRYPDVMNATSVYIQLTINRKLAQYPMQIAFEMSEEGKLRKALVPTSLLSAMWYQLYLATIGEIKLRRCSICGKWENMEGHRINWSKHAACANNERVKRSRSKKA